MAALVLATGAAVLVFVPPDREDYLAVVSRKVELIETVPSPRIVFVGGSNLAFGLDSRKVEEELGRRVVNMGMGFNMGLRFMLDLVSPRIAGGDIVVLVPEYNLFFGLLDGDERLLDVLELYPEGWRYVHSRNQYWNLAKNSFRHVKFKVNRVLQQIGHESDADCVYCPRAFDENGDIVAHFDKPKKDVARMSFLKSGGTQVDAEAVEVVREFAREMEGRGARVVLLYPCLPQPQFELRKAAIERLDRALRAGLGIAMPASPQDYVFPAERFYDWVYHLDREGRAERTARIVEDIRPVIEAARTASR
jgi:hypothetical protein